MSLIPLIFAIACAAMFLFMTLLPKKWESYVSAENSYVAKRGLISESFAQKLTRIETSQVFKIGVALLALINGYFAF